MSSADYNHILDQVEAAFSSSVEHSNQHEKGQSQDMHQDETDEDEEEFVIMTEQDLEQEVQNHGQQRVPGDNKEAHAEQVEREDTTHGEERTEMEQSLEEDEAHINPQARLNSEPKSQLQATLHSQLVAQIPDAGPPVSGRAKGLTAEEKKERQRAQNRKAAEKSRNKRKNEQMTLELNVANMQEENSRLRERIQSLLSSQTSNLPVDPIPPVDPVHSPPPPSTATLAMTGTGVDYMYISKLQHELTNAKTMLLERSMALKKLKTGREPVMDEHHGLKVDVLSNMTKVAGLQAEVAGLQTVLAHLCTEKEELENQKQRVSKELENKRAVRDVVTVVLSGLADCE
ncbi:hypothetical protein L204_106089 [Cryptococcus depauperatus]|nr:hypothetical protein L204_05218 [Cryptococcus depauperatus CBS 7855]